MSANHQMPDDPSQDPEQALDAMEEQVFGSTMNQLRRDDTPDPDQDRPEDGAISTPTTAESPA